MAGMARGVDCIAGEERGESVRGLALALVVVVEVEAFGEVFECGHALQLGGVGLGARMAGHDINYPTWATPDCWSFLAGKGILRSTTAITADSSASAALP